MTLRFAAQNIHFNFTDSYWINVYISDLFEDIRQKSAFTQFRHLIDFE